VVHERDLSPGKVFDKQLCPPARADRTADEPLGRAFLIGEQSIRRENRIPRVTLQVWSGQGRAGASCGHRRQRD
jgi:hypothetical protein